MTDGTDLGGEQEDGQVVVRHEAFGRPAELRADAMEEELAQLKEEAESLSQELEQEREHTSQLEDEVDRIGGLAKQLEEALEAAEAKMHDDEEQVIALKAKITTLERELDKSHSQPTHVGMDTEVQADIDALEGELADANKEVARLNTLLAQSPARKAIDKAKDAKIELLEKEKEDLQERLKMLKTSSVPTMSTPHKFANGSGISPMHRQILAMSFKSPKTPGGPLRDVSFVFLMRPHSLSYALTSRCPGFRRP